VQLNILCLICINRQYPQNCIEFDNDAWVLLNFIRNTVKQERSLMHMISPDKIYYVRSKSEWDVCRTLLKGRKHFSQSVIISVTVSKLGKTDLVFVQPGAKNKQCLLLWERTRTRFTAGNSPYLEQRLRVPTRTPFTRLSLTCIPTGLSSLNQKTGRRTVQI